jgi:hypothetical protein
MKQKAYDKQFEEFRDEYILNFLYQIESIDRQLPSEEGWNGYINWQNLDEDLCKMELSFGSSGYSDGWSEDWEVYWGDPEWIIVNTDSSSYSPYGESEDKKELKFNSFKELLEEIKEHFGL